MTNQTINQSAANVLCEETSHSDKVLTSMSLEWRPCHRPICCMWLSHTHTNSQSPVLNHLISNMKGLFQSACYSLQNLIFNNVVVRHSYYLSNKKSPTKMRWLTTQKELFPFVFIFLSNQMVICQIHVSIL